MYRSILGVFGAAVLSCCLFATPGCGPKVVETPELSDAEKEKKQEDYAKEYEDKMKKAMEEAQKQGMKQTAGGQQ